MQLTEPQKMGLRGLLMVNQLFSFLIPGYLFLRLFAPAGEAGKIFSKGPLKRWEVILLSAVLLFVATPTVIYSYQVNTWILEFSGRVTDGSSMPRALQAILDMGSPWALIANLLLVALIPAMGEELVFRGLAMRILQRATDSTHLGIWISAMLFSFFHFQIEGFLPRMVLGLVLGYSFEWTRTLWIPALLHFLNNGLQVAAIYYGFSRYSEMELEKLPAIPAYLAALSVISIYLSGRLIQRYARKSI